MAIRITLSPSEQGLLESIRRKRSTPEFLKERLHIVLAAAQGLNNRAISQHHGYEVHRVGVWRNRWAKAHHAWQTSDPNLRPAMNADLVLQWMSDQPRSGRPVRITVEQKTTIAALSKEPPEIHGFPVTHWSGERLAQAAMQRGVVDKISRPTVSRLLKKTT